jgi:2-iminobutanoate/2-iminopropanoate deaminase
MAAMTQVETDRAPAAVGPYSQGIAAGPWVFVSGQIGMIPGTGELAGPAFADQARQALENLGAVIEAAGCQRSDVVSVEVFLTDMGRFAEVNEIYADFFGDHRPARAALGVSALPKGAAVEVKCIAQRSG